MEENQIQIPEGWRKVALGKVLRYAQPYRFIVKSTNYDAKSGTPVLTAGKSFILGYTDETDNIYSETPVIIFDDFTTDTKFVDFPFKVKSSAMKFLKAVDEKEIDLKYAFEKIQTIKITETGGDHKRRWISEYSKIEVLLPEFTEQQYIANILSKTDQAIANTEALIAKYTHIKTGLMQDLFTNGIGNDEFELVRTDLKNIKAKSNFHITTLKTITKVRQGYQIAISSRKKEEGQNRFVYITVQYLNNPKKYLEYIENPPAEVISKYDDILFTRTGNTGQIVTNIVGVYHNNFFKVDFDKKLITKDYLLLFLQWKPVKDLILELAGTTTIPDLKHKDFYSIPIFFPKNLDEQNAITDSINKANEVVERYEAELSKLQSLKTGLMQDLLTGKVRVKI